MSADGASTHIHLNDNVTPKCPAVLILLMRAIYVQNKFVKNNKKGPHTRPV